MFYDRIYASTVLSRTGKVYSPFDDIEFYGKLLASQNRGMEFKESILRIQTDKASMLDEVIEYLKQLQAQVQMMSRMNMQPMMLPLALQQQLQMSMMAPMSMGMAGMGMGMGVMDMNTIAARSNMTGIPPALHPTAFIPLTTWDGSSGHDRLQTTAADPMSAFLACQTQPMTMDAYSRMAAMYQQLHQQPPASNPKG